MKLTEIKTDIDAICRLYGIEDYTINSDGSIDVDGNVNLKNRAFTQFPLRFGKVTGMFNCFGSKNLRTLEGAPTSVGGNFYCYECISLTSLKGAPTEVGGSFSCSKCPILSLEGVAPNIAGSFYCYECPIDKLSHLKTVNLVLYFTDTKITNYLFTLKIKGLKSIESSIPPADAIINSYLTLPVKDRDIMECQEELIEAGLEKYAKLK